MRIAFFTTGGFRTDELFLYMFARVAQRFPDVHIVAVSPPREWSSKGFSSLLSRYCRKMRRLGLLETLEIVSSYPLQRFFRSRDHKTTQRRLQQLPRTAIALDQDRVVFVQSVNGPDAIQTMTSLQPRNIYGVTKLAAEDLCRLFHQLHRLPMIVLRTSRFFPEEDDMAHAIKQSGENTKANELLFRRLSVEDAAEAHVVALGKAPELGFDTFIISSMTPFCPADCRELLADAPGVVARYFPDYRAKYEKLGWTMFDSIDRIYDASKARRVLGFACKIGFRELLDGL